MADEDQREHRRDEQVEVAEEPAAARVVLHVADGVDVDQRADAGDQQQEQRGQLVVEQVHADAERAGLEPGPEVLADLALLRVAAEQGEEQHQAEHEGQRRQRRCRARWPCLSAVALSEAGRNGATPSSRTAPSSGQRDDQPQQVEHAVRPRCRARPRDAWRALGIGGRRRTEWDNRFTSAPSVLQQAGVVDRGRASGAEDGHDDREPDHDLGSSHHHHEEGGDLAVEVAVLLGEGDEREVAGVEHQLDAHEHHDGVAAGEDTHAADREEDRGEDDVLRSLLHVLFRARRGAGLAGGLGHRRVAVPVSRRSGGVRRRCRRRARGPSGPCRGRRAPGRPRTRRRCRRAAGPGCRPRCGGRRRRARAAGRGACRARRSRASAARPGRPASAFGREALAVGEHHRAERGGDQQGAGGLEGEDVAGEQDVGDRRDVAAGVGLVEPDHGAERDLAEADDQDDAEDQAEDDRHHALAADRLHDRVGGVDADQHHHEEEQHQDRAGVDDDLHREQERRVQHGVEERQADHHHGEQQRGVHGLADEQDAERGGHHDRGEDPEASFGPPRVRRGRGRRCRGSSRPRRRRAASGAAAAPCRAAAGRAGRTSRR